MQAAATRPRLGRLFQVEEEGIHDTCDVSLTHGADGVLEVGFMEASDKMEKDPVFDMLGQAD